MRHRSLLILTSVLTTGALSLTACGSRGDDSKKGDDGGGSTATTTTVVIGVDAPLTGQNSATGLGLQYGVQIAVDDANAKHLVPGVTFKVKALDDKALPASGQQNATALVADNSVIAAVGPLNSGVAQSMQQVFANANMVEISPANTNPTLTLGKDWATGKKVRPFKTYFRTATTDALQGGFAADYAYNTLKKKSAFVVDDKQTYGGQAWRASSTTSSPSSGARSPEPTTSTPATPTSPPWSRRSGTRTPTSSTTAASTTSPS